MKTIWALACLGLLCFAQAYDDSRCTARRGKCRIYSSPCKKGNYYTGLCGGPKNRRCCIPSAVDEDLECTGLTGTCQFTSVYCPGDRYWPGMCGGPKNRQCCVPFDGGGDDNKCLGRAGTCQYTSSVCSGGSYESGLCAGPPDRQCCIPRVVVQGTCPQEQKELACDLFRASNVKAARRHPSGVKDNAYPYNNLRDMCNGTQASRSSYYCKDKGCYAPGGTTCLSLNLLTYLKDLMDTGVIIRINELAGACHSCESRHYSGLAVDLHRDNPRRGKMYMARCKDHSGWAQNEARHVHCQFYDERHPNWL